MAIVIYLMIPLYMGLLYMLSAQEKLPLSLTETGIQRAFYKIAAYIYRRFLKGSSIFKRSPSGRKVRTDLRTLNSKSDVQEEERAYYIKKLSTTLMLITMGAFLASVAFLSARRSDAFNEEGQLIRGDYADTETTRFLNARGVNGEDYGEFQLEIQSRSYTRQQAEKLLEEMLEKIPVMILGENTELSHIDSDLTLIGSVPSYPFSIEWKSDDTSILHSDGRIESDELTKEGAQVELKAQITYKDMEWVKSFPLNIYPKPLTGIELIKNSIRKELLQNEESTREKDYVPLPENAGGTKLLWNEKVEDLSPLIMMLVIISSALIFIASDKELSKEVSDRRMKMTLEYPGFISRLVLYMGAGMSVRGIFKLFTDEYKASLKLGKGKSFLYEEISRSCHELESGVSELKVYERLGERCGSQQYTRLVTLLSQNLRKGNSELLLLLREEADKATRERMSYARKLGEEAGTKLLVPMIMMLLIVMVVVVVPAYLSF